MFDENLSPKLVVALGDVFPDSNHVQLLGLGSSEDQEVWEYARTNRFTLISKDSDFFDLSVLHGYPPKVIWFKRGNCSNKTVELALRNNHGMLLEFYGDATQGVVVLL